VLYDSTRVRKAICRYGEREAAQSGIRYDTGWKLMAQLIQKDV